MNTNRVTLFFHTVLSFILLALPAFAQEGDSPSQAFEASNEAPKENLPAWPFLYGAYFCIWGLLFGYMFYTWYRNVQLSGRIAALDGRLDDVLAPGAPTVDDEALQHRRLGAGALGGRNLLRCRHDCRGIMR